MGLRDDKGEAIRTSTGLSTARAASTGERPRGWAEPPALALDEMGIIQRCSESCEKLFGYASFDLVKQHISWLFPQLSGHQLVMDGRFNPMLDFLCHCGHPFQTQNRHGDTFKSELNFVRIETEGQRSLRLIIRPFRSDHLPDMFRHDHAI